MALYRTIEKLQQKSDREKKRILTGLTVISAALLLVGGMFSFRATLRGEELAFVPPEERKEAEEASESPPVESLRGPFASLKDGLVLVAGDIQEKVGEFAENIQEEETAAEEQRLYVPLPVE